MNLVQRLWVLLSILCLSSWLWDNQRLVTIQPTSKIALTLWPKKSLFSTSPPPSTVSVNRPWNILSAHTYRSIWQKCVHCADNLARRMRFRLIELIQLSSIKDNQGTELPSQAFPHLWWNEIRIPLVTFCGVWINHYCQYDFFHFVCRRGGFRNSVSLTSAKYFCVIET